MPRYKGEFLVDPLECKCYYNFWEMEDSCDENTFREFIKKYKGCEEFKEEDI
jgi:hypothetical protein